MSPVQSKTVLLIEPAPNVRGALSRFLVSQGYAVVTADTGEGGLTTAAERLPDVVLLGASLPDLTSLEVCAKLRQWSTMPVIVLGTQPGDAHAIAALDHGADQYLVRPFSFAELAARLRAAGRRRELPDPPSVQAGDLQVDFAGEAVRLRGREVLLTPLERKLLLYLARNADRVVTHRQLLAAVWGCAQHPEPNTLRNHIANLRHKIEPDPLRPCYIQSEPRVGYRFRRASPKDR